MSTGRSDFISLEMSIANMVWRLAGLWKLAGEGRKTAAWQATGWQGADSEVCSPFMDKEGTQDFC